MGNTNVEVLPKKSVRAFRYLGAFIFFIVGVFIIWNGQSFGLKSLRILTLLAGSLTMFLSLLWIPHTYKFKINMDSNRIRQTGLLSKEIPYQDIEKLIVRKGFIEICGNNVFNRISIGDLYNNFNTATEILASNIGDGNQVAISGQRKYINEYFGDSPK